MAHVQLFILLIISVSLNANEYWFEEFYSNVDDNIEAASNYVAPTRNLELINVTNETLYDVGTYDFIIVGGGAAGSTLANRLSEIKHWNILLLEAGGKQTEFSTIPGFAGNLVNTPMAWGYYSTPQTNACLGWANNSCSAARGKVLGGTSVINYKLYVRGNRNDFDNWASLGNTGWSYEEVLPYFIQMENTHIYNAEFGYHGHSGELDVSYPEPTPWTDIHIDAIKELGFDKVDYNGHSQIGVSQVQYNNRGIRSLSGAIAFLDPIINNRRNLKIELNAFVTKILINKSRKSASGVEFVQNGKRFLAKARKEVVLSAGAYNTPQVLMLSGIGPREELEQHGIETLLDLPVGKNLMDHFSLRGLVFKTNLTAYNETLRTQLEDYLQGHRPLVAESNGDTVWFFNSVDETDSQPDIEIVSLVSTGFAIGKTYLVGDLSTVFNENYNPLSDIFFLIYLTNPKSRGTVTLQSADPADFPLIDFNFLSDPAGEDIDHVYTSVLKLLTALDTKPFKAINGSLARSFSGCEDYEEYCRDWWYCTIRIFSGSGAHPSGTAKMGVSTEDSVVDSNLLVHGLKKLRVVDASVIPVITTGNIAAPTFMIANKISDTIKKTYLGAGH